MADPLKDALHVQANGAAVSSLYQRGLTWVSFRPLPDRACGIDFKMRKFADLGLLSGTVQGIRHEHTRDSQADDDIFSLHINMSGTSIVAGRGREVTLGEGEAMLFDYSVSRTITRPGTVDHRIIRLPRTVLAPLVPRIDDALLRPIPRGTGALNMLACSIAGLIDDPVLDGPATRRLIASQLGDLVAVTLGATRDAIAVAEGRGLRAARLRAIKADIEAHLTDAGLSPMAVARRQQISDSYIRKLFESEATSFSDFVLTRRLTRARRLLADPSSPARSILSVALDCGFGDLSYFNRTFKRRFGVTPTEARRLDRTQLD